MQSLQGAGVNGGNIDPQQLLLAETGGRVESVPPQNVWSAQQGFDHAFPSHHLQQLHQQQIHQQQIQQQLMLGGPGSLAPLVGQQLSQLLGPGQQQHQSPPGIGGAAFNMMFSGPPHMPMAGQVFQSPPTSNGQFFILPGNPQHRGFPGQGEATAVSPNSNSELHTPTPSATPPTINLDNRESSLLMSAQNKTGGSFDLERQSSELDQAMAMRGLQAMQGGALNDMFPNMGQLDGLERQIGAPPCNIERGLGGPTAGFPVTVPGPNGHGVNNLNFAIAAQAQENMMRLQQLQQSQEFHKQMPPNFPQFHQFQGPPLIPQPDIGRPFTTIPPPLCQSPSPNSLSHPPGPRPRPVGGDSSPPGFSADTLPPPPLGDDPNKGQSKNSEQTQLIIGSWNDECEKTGPPPPATIVQNLTQPPPRHGNQEWGGTFHVPKSGSQNWNREEVENKGTGRNFNNRSQNSDQKGKRGNRGGRGTSNRGRGVGNRSSDAEIIQEKAMGKNAAIEETKAMMAKMRLEEKEMMNKYKKEMGLPEDNLEENKVQPGAYRPRERRGRDDRKDGQRGRGGRGKGRGIPTAVAGLGGPVPHLYGAPPAYIPGDFRTPPFPGMEGFIPPTNVGQFSPGFPPHFVPGLPPGVFPGAFSGDMRGRGGYYRGRGFPAGFPPKVFQPPPVGNRGGRGGRGGTHHSSGKEKDSREIKDVDQHTKDNEDNITHADNETDIKEDITSVNLSNEEKSTEGVVEVNEEQ